jgi:hypothetical protein
MRIVWIGCLVLAMSGVVGAGVKKPGKDFWNVLVAPKATWVLHEPSASGDAAQKSGTVIVETYDVRTVGRAKVARLRWTHKDSTGEATTFGGNTVQPTQVAVTPAGLYLLDAAMDDAAVAAALTKKPARSSPPRPYKGTKQNGGRYLKVYGDKVCMGWANVEGECGDVCESEVCFSATAGVTSITGFDAPGGMIWER